MMLMAELHHQRDIRYLVEHQSFISPKEDQFSLQNLRVLATCQANYQEAHQPQHLCIFHRPTSNVDAFIKCHVHGGPMNMSAASRKDCPYHLIESALQLYLLGG